MATRIAMTDASDIAEALKEIIGEKRDPKKGIDPLAQAMELQARYRTLTETSVPTLTAGDLCKFKEVFAHDRFINRYDGEVVFILMFPIDTQKPMHMAYLEKWCAAADVEPTDDWFAGFMMPDSNHFIIRPITLARLRPLTADETKGLD